MLKVSIIIPTYNHATFLPDAINSVLSQTYRDVEIIVVDDGSTDNTRQVAAGFGESIRYIYQENRGLPAARNAGIVQARGEFISVLDADDLYTPPFVEKMLTSIEESNGAAAYCGFRMVDANGLSLFQIGVHNYRPEAQYFRFLDGNFIVPHCMLVRREAYEQVGFFDESLSACEDWDMWLRLSQCYPVISVPIVLALYRLLPGSMSGDPLRMLNNRIRVLTKHVGLIENATTDTTRSAYARAYFITAIEYLQNHRIIEAIDCLVNAFELYPLLLGEIQTFYELALWDQPKGWRGDLKRIDPEVNEIKLFDLLNRLIKMLQLDVEHRNNVYGLAFDVLGRFSYGRSAFAQARRYWLRSAAIHPRQIANRQIAGMFIKSFFQRQHTLPRVDPIFD